MLKAHQETAAALSDIPELPLACMKESWTHLQSWLVRARVIGARNHHSGPGLEPNDQGRISYNNTSIKLGFTLGW